MSRGHASLIYFILLCLSEVTTPGHANLQTWFYLPSLPIFCLKDCFEAKTDIMQNVCVKKFMPDIKIVQISCFLGCTRYVRRVAKAMCPGLHLVCAHGCTGTFDDTANLALLELGVRLAKIYQMHAEC